MIPDHRLAVLLNHVKQSQINQCLYHNTAAAPSLYSDHMCDRNDFPLRATIELSQHSNEVWYCEFSHDGTKLATASRDHSVIIYDTATFTVLHRFVEHEGPVAHVSWSPDDTKLIACSQDKKARVWNVEVGVTIAPISERKAYGSFVDGTPSSHHRPPQRASNRGSLGCRWTVFCNSIS